MQQMIATKWWDHSSGFILTLSPLAKTGSVRNSESILSTAAPWKQQTCKPPEFCSVWHTIPKQILKPVVFLLLAQTGETRSLSECSIFSWCGDVHLSYSRILWSSTDQMKWKSVVLWAKKFHHMGFRFICIIFNTSVKNVERQDCNRSRVSQTLL